MKKNKLLIAVALSTALAASFTAFAAASDAPAAKNIRSFFKIDASKLTDQQKSDVAEYSKKMADLQKEFINKMADNGTMTREQADAAIKEIDEALNNGTANSLLPGFGMGKGEAGARGKQGNIGGIGSIDTSKLTNEQKTDLLNTYTQMANLQKELVGKMVDNGLLTKEQGDATQKKIDEISKMLQDSGLSKANGMFIGGFGSFDCLRIGKIDTSKLTDEQKADLTSYSTSMKSLQKELVDKMVNYGLITSEQGNILTKKLEGTDSINGKNGNSKDMEMKKGRPDNFKKPGNSNTNTSRTSATN